MEVNDLAIEVARHSERIKDLEQTTQRMLSKGDANTTLLITVLISIIVNIALVLLKG
jgi:hypothetical protein